MNKKTLICSVILLLGFNFYGSVFLTVPNSIIKIIILVSIAWGWMKMNKNTLLSKPLIWMLFFLIISCLSSMIFREQNFIRTFLASNISYSLLLYFFFTAIAPSNKQCDKIIVILSTLYCVSYIIQLAVIPVQLFKLDEFMLEGNTTRLRLAGSALATLGYFYSLNKLLTEKNKLYIFLLIITLFTILLMGFRTILVAIAISSFIYLLSINKIKLESTFIFAIMIISAYILINNTEWGRNVFNGMIERQKEETFSNKDYVRWIGFDAYWNHYLDTFEKLFGIGSAYENSPNENDITSGKIGAGAVWVDWGIVGLSFYNGIITCIIQVYCIIKLIFTRIKPQYKYLQIWLFTILLCSVTTGEYIRLGNTAVIAFVLYWIEQNKIKYENSRRFNYYN